MIQFEDRPSLFKMKFNKLRYHIMLNTIIICALAFGVKNGILRSGYFPLSMTCHEISISKLFINQSLNLVLRAVVFLCPTVYVNYVAWGAGSECKGRESALRTSAGRTDGVRRESPTKIYTRERELRGKNWM